MGHDTIALLIALPSMPTTSLDVEAVLTHLRTGCGLNTIADAGIAPAVNATATPYRPEDRVAALLMDIATQQGSTMRVQGGAVVGAKSSSAAP